MSLAPTRSVYAPLSLLLSATLWGLVWYPLRLLEDQGLNGLWATLISYGAALLLVATLAGRHLRDVRRHPMAALVMLVASGWCNVAFVLAVIDGSVARVLILFYLSPIWAVLFGRFILGERLQPGMAWLLLLALFGAGLMLFDPSHGLPLPQVRAEWLALSSGVAFALSNVLVRLMSDVSLTCKILVTWIGVVAVSAIWLLVTVSTLPSVGVPVVMGAVMLGLSGFLVATFAVQYGVTHMPVQRSAVILLVEVVVGGVSAAWLAGETLTLRDWVGGGLILLAGYLVTLKETQTS